MTHKKRTTDQIESVPIMTPATDQPFRFPRKSPAEVQETAALAVDEETRAEVAPLYDAVCRDGDAALRRSGERFDALQPGAPLVLDREALAFEAQDLSEAERACIERSAERIRSFAEAQRACLKDLDVQLPGVRAGHRFVPLDSAACYAPGGRHPLPSTVLMTVLPATVAGVPRVWVASPKPAPATCYAALIAGADALLAVGGPAAIAAFAEGTASVPVVATIVGPGNRWVTAAKERAARKVRIDALAGPSELLVVAESHANPRLVAADLLAQAEHDPEARPMLITTSEPLLNAVEAAVEGALQDLPTAEVARQALSTGFAVLVQGRAEALELADRIAPEHLELHLDDEPTAEALQRGDALKSELTHRRAGAIFSGPAAAEVFGDYGAGPNHVLPTGGTARFQGGLSVANFLALRTFMVSGANAIADRQLLEDSATLARLEGLEAHARAAEARGQS